MRKITVIELWYPRSNTNEYPNAVEIDLVDVRAANSILVEYDFDRDGWMVSKPTVHSWPIDDNECDPQYKEVAFISGEF